MNNLYSVKLFLALKISYEDMSSEIKLGRIKTNP